MKNKSYSKEIKGQRYIVRQDSTLLAYLFEIFKAQSKSSVKSILTHGQVSVNGHPATHYNTPLNKGDVLFINNEKGRIEFNHPLMKIVWEDDDLIVINKKEGLLSVSTSIKQERTAYFILNEYVKKNDARNKIFILHRLDKGTSGLMIFAKNKAVQEKLRANWHQIITQRIYTAVVEGKPEKSSDTITSYLAENVRMKVYCTDPQNGKEAVLHYNTIKSNDKYSLIEVDLETGRKNQIRVQMESRGHPVVGDSKYGAKSDPYGRLMLHAKSLCFIHPMSNEEMKFELQPPKSFKDIFNK
jgi:23S rRNA pseudouridine1911/1915/1917 synthase